MKKEIMAALLAIGFLFAGVMSASAASITWTLIETGGMVGKSPGADNLLGTADDGTGDTCNYSNATACAATGSPTTGTYSFSQLTFVQTSSCVIASGGNNPGDFCTQNSDCGSPLGICVDCNTGTGGVGLSYFARNPAGGSKGLGTFTLNACDNGFSYSNISIGTSEVLTASGGSCMTLAPGTDVNTGCSVGTVSTTYDLRLHTSTIPNCGFLAGTMPGLSLAGRVYDATSITTGSCTYTVAEIGGIVAGAGLGAGDYLIILCGSGTLPTGLQSVCISGASWTAVLVAKTSVGVPAACGEACSSSCMAGTAEAVE